MLSGDEELLFYFQAFCTIKQVLHNWLGQIFLKITHQNLEIVFAIKAILQGPKKPFVFYVFPVGNQ